MIDKSNTPFIPFKNEPVIITVNYNFIIEQITARLKSNEATEVIKILMQLDQEQKQSI